MKLMIKILLLLLVVVLYGDCTPPPQPPIARTVPSGGYSKLIEDFGGSSTPPGGWSALLNSVSESGGVGSGTGASTNIIYTDQSYDQNFMAQIEIITKPGNGKTITICGAGQDMTAVNVADFYCARANQLVGTDEIKLFKLNNNSQTDLGTASLIEFDANDRIKIVKTTRPGTNTHDLKLYFSDDGGEWSLEEEFSETDSDMTGDGPAIVLVNGTAGEFDNVIYGWPSR